MKYPVFDNVVKFDGTKWNRDGSMFDSGYYAYFFETLLGKADFCT